MVTSNNGSQLVLECFSPVYTVAEQRLDAGYRWLSRLPLALTQDGYHVTTDYPVRVLRPMGVVVDRLLSAALIDHLASLKFYDR